jgi:hypothetical protein
MHVSKSPEAAVIAAWVDIGQAACGALETKMAVALVAYLRTT